MIFEVSVIMVCALIVAVEPALRGVREFRNWLERREAHKRSIANVE